MSVHEKIQGNERQTSAVLMQPSTIRTAHRGRWFDAAWFVSGLSLLSLDNSQLKRLHYHSVHCTRCIARGLLNTKDNNTERADVIASKQLTSILEKNIPLLLCIFKDVPSGK